MRSNNSSSSSSGIGFCGMLAVLFIGLKLANIINWSWWWVLSPLWIGLIIVALIIFLVSMAVIITHKN
jgi:hypothetical protein